jgi:hypothetical protein
LGLSGCGRDQRCPPPHPFRPLTSQAEVIAGKGSGVSCWVSLAHNCNALWRPTMGLFAMLSDNFLINQPPSVCGGPRSICLFAPPFLPSYISNGRAKSGNKSLSICFYEKNGFFLRKQFAVK